MGFLGAHVDIYILRNHQLRGGKNDYNHAPTTQLFQYPIVRDCLTDHSRTPTPGEQY